MASKRDLTVKHRRGAETPELPPEKEEKPVSAGKKKKRRRWGRSALLHLLFRLVLVVVLVLAVALLWRNRNRLAPAALVEWFDRVVTGGEGGNGYPVAISGSQVIAMQSLGSQTAVLTDTSLIVYNSAGAVLTDRHHTYGKPVLHTGGEYMLITESGGSRYSLSTRKEILYSGQTANTLRNASVDEDGRIVLVTGSTQSYMSEVLVVDRSGKELFHWYGADITAVDAAVSPGGKRVAVLGLSAQGGEMRSTLQLFPLAGKEAKAEYTYSGTGAMMVSLRCFNNGNLGVVGDSAAWICDPGGSTEIYPYGDAELLGYAFSEKGLGLVTRGLGESDGGSFLGISPSGKQQQPVTFTGEFRHVAASESGWYLLTDDTLYDLTSDGVSRRAEAARDSLMVTELNGKPLVLSLTAITRCEW